MEAITISKEWLPIGVTDECTTCSACGKSNLKKTVVFESTDGDIKYLGCDCASRLATSQSKNGSKNTTADKTLKSIRTMNEIIAIAQCDLDAAISSRDAGKIHPQGIAWEQSISIRTANLDRIKAQYSITLEMI